MLYDTLTVKEHLWFFGRLKGLTRDEAGGEIDKMMESIKLADKSTAQTRYLSGGMKRKLSLGLALIGKAKVRCPSYTLGVSFEISLIYSSNDFERKKSRPEKSL